MVGGWVGEVGGARMEWWGLVGVQDGRGNGVSGGAWLGGGVESSVTVRVGGVVAV